jgi:hypothetical protein
MNFGTEEIMTLLGEFAKKYPLVVERGGEYIMQDDEAQVDALQLVCNIFDNMFSFYRPYCNVNMEDLFELPESEE